VRLLSPIVTAAALALEICRRASPRAVMLRDVLTILANEATQGQPARSPIEGSGIGTPECDAEVNVRDADEVRAQIEDGSHLQRPIPNSTPVSVARLHLVTCAA